VKVKNEAQFSNGMANFLEKVKSTISLMNNFPEKDYSDIFVQQQKIIFDSA
jgi:hypothetical protein